MDTSIQNREQHENTPTELVRETYDWATTIPSLAIIETIAAVEDTDPVGLSEDNEIALGDYFDPEALDQLIADGHQTVASVTVAIEHYTIRLTDGGLVMYDRGVNSPSIE